MGQFQEQKQFFTNPFFYRSRGYDMTIFTSSALADIRTLPTPDFRQDSCIFNTLCITYAFVCHMHKMQYEERPHFQFFACLSHCIGQVSMACIRASMKTQTSFFAVAQKSLSILAKAAVQNFSIFNEFPERKCVYLCVLVDQNIRKNLFI